MTSRRFDLVVFDCDGVLVDSERLSIRVDLHYLERLGWPMTESEVVERFVGRSDADMRADIEAFLGGPVPAEIETEFERLYRRTFDEELQPVEGIAGVLEAVAGAGIRMCVASSGTHAKIRRSLELTDLAGWFDDRTIFSATDVPNGKPAPDLFLHAASAMRVAPDRSAVVEDSVYGVQAALAAGMTAFAYAGGITPRSRLAALGDGAVTFERMAALPGLLGLRSPER